MKNRMQLFSVIPATCLGEALRSRKAGIQAIIFKWRALRASVSRIKCGMTKVLNSYNRINIALLCLFISTCSYADSLNQKTFHQIQAQLSQAHCLSGNFKQIRKMHLLSNPLISTGHFNLSKNSGLQWIQTTPFPSSITVTSSTIIQQIGDNPPDTITKAQQPVVFSFSNIFLSLFNGDMHSVKEHFKISFTGNTTHWTITLKPISSPLNKAIESITVAGGKYVHTVTIQEAKQNQMSLIFSQVKDTSQGRQQCATR